MSVHRHYLLFSLLVLLIFYFLSLTFYQSQKSLQGDFSSFWLSSWWLREKPQNTPLYYAQESDGHSNLRIWTMIRSSEGKLFKPWQELGRKHDFPNPKFYLYPPIFALFFLPITFFSVHVGVQVWGFINALAFLLALGILTFLWKPLRLRLVSWALMLCSLSFFFYPVLWSLELGQNSLLLFLIWVAFVLFLEKGREIFAGLALGILIMIKLSPVLLIPWLLCRRFLKTSLTCLFTLFLLLGLSLVIAGGEHLRDYFFELVPLISSGTHFYENQSLLAVLLRMDPTVDVVTAPPGIVDHLSHGVYVGLLFFLFFVQFLHIFLKPISRHSMGYEITSWILFICLISPVSWSHHLVISLLALFLILKDVLESSNRFRLWKIIFLIVCFLLMAFPIISIDWIRVHRHPFFISHRFFGMLLLWIYFQRGLLSCFNKKLLRVCHGSGT